MTYAQKHTGQMLYNIAQESNTFLQVKTTKRLYHCTAYIYDDEVNGLVWLRSYNTIVACYNKESGCLHRFGRYSSTTYQHYRKFRNWLWENGAPAGARPWDIVEVQHEFENWYR